jgi:signal transduction histidine kinase/CheY-like chemotaxis protein
VIKGYILPMFSNRQKYVMRYDSWEIPEAARENLVYGVRYSPFKAGNIEFIGIVGISQIDMIEKRLKVDSFGGRGYVGIIDIDGNYVVSRERSAGIGKADNYFDQLRINTALSENEINDIINRLTQGEAFIEHIDYNNQVDQVVSFINMPETTWSIVLTVPQDVFSEQTQQFVVMTGIMLGVVVVVLCLMMLVIIRISVVSRTAKAEAKSRGDFLSSMSHEIRTPLNGIIGLNHLMQENTQNPEKLEEYLTKSDSTAKYLLSLVNDILDMSKLQAGKIETEILWSDIIGDETRIEQILMNILGNAVKFTQKDGSITMRVFQVREKSSRVITVYEIEDTGCGMSEEFQKIIFDLFSQEHNNVSRGTHGTGLGMAISFLLAKQMDGTLSVQSKLGIGSCFTFRLPAEIADGVQDTNRKNYAVPEAVDIVQDTAPEREKVKILVTEDNELNAEILLEILKNAGFSAVRANDGGQAVDIFEASSLHEFGIILMDVQMPVLNGYEATKVIRAMNRSDAKTVIIYACTDNTFKDDQVKDLESGMNGFIAKPIDVDKLMQKLG